MDLIERRSHLSATPNPEKKLDYIVNLQGHPPRCAGRTCALILRYVPDRSVLDAQAFGTYLDAIALIPWDTPEDLAVTVLGDINDKIIPRWIQVRLELADPHHPCVDAHAVILEDRQPGWDNPDLLARLERI